MDKKEPVFVNGRLYTGKATYGRYKGGGWDGGRTERLYLDPEPAEGSEVILVDLRHGRIRTCVRQISDTQGPSWKAIDRLEAEIEVYIPPTWLHNRAVIRSTKDNSRWVVRRLRLSLNQLTSCADLIPYDVAEVFDPTAWNRAARCRTLFEIEEGYDTAGLVMSPERAPL